MESKIKCRVFKPKLMNVTWKIMLHDSSTGEEYGLSYTCDTATKSKTKISREFIKFMNTYMSALGIKNHNVFIGIYSDSLSSDDCAVDFREFIRKSNCASGIRYMPKLM